LRSDVQGSLRGIVTWLNHETNIHSWARLDYAVRTGQCALEHVYGKKTFDFLFADPERAAVFNEAMTSFSGMTAAAAVDAYDFGQAKKVVDVGGGHGLLLAMILRKHPALRGVLHDLPNVLSGATGLLAAQGVADRCETVAGDFFESVPEGADLYTIKAVLHDWSDEACTRILRNIHRAAAPGAKLVVIEAVIEAGNGPQIGKFLDLEMLTMTDGGRERTREEFAQLFAASGFHLERVVQTPAPQVVIEAIRTDT
jgi:hypothetical protein